MHTMKRLIKRTLEITMQHGHCHLPSTLSALSVMGPIFETFDKANDVFILSKGHAAAALYACLESIGYSPCLTKSHPERDPSNGITCTTGSLGHGLPMAVGIAKAKKIAGQQGTVFCLMGDGECLEGTTWEALNIAKQLSLDNLHVHIDGNRCGALGKLPVNCASSLCILFPTLVTYHATEKGAGVSCIRGTTDHKRTLTQDEYNQSIIELQ